MNEQAPMRLSLPRFHARFEQAIRFIVNLIGLWIVCALGIYLIGPDEPKQVEATVVSQVRAQINHSSDQE